MAERGGAGKSPTAWRPATTGAVPEPPPVLHVTPHVWPAGDPMHRVHLDRHAAEAFNPGHQGNARFSPIADAAGTPIPTLYGGSSFDCAAMDQS